MQVKEKSKTKNFTECLSLLMPHIKEFTHFSFYIRKSLGSSKVIGIRCQACNILRKDLTMNRVKEQIEKLDLDLEVIDCPNCFFQIREMQFEIETGND